MNCPLILFLFTIEWYVTNKKWYMRPPSRTPQSRYLTFSQRVQKATFALKVSRNFFSVKNQPESHYCFWSQKWISCKSDEFWSLGNKKFFESIFTDFDPPRTNNRKFCSKSVLKSWKIGPETIWRPTRFQVLRILLNFSLKDRVNWWFKVKMKFNF